jgi:rhamnose utilization protein RhaD (predicted bifunctional aldolase and dehydrogenase)
LSELDELLALSQAVAGRPDWAQAAGGNHSVKGATSLFIKASGCRMGELAADKGWVRLDLASARAVLNDAHYDALPHGVQQDQAGAALLGALHPSSPAGRPSLEAGFHVLGPRVCLHLHVVEALAGLALKDGRAWFERILAGSGLRWAWVDYRPPGHSLAKLVQAALQANPEAQIVLMKNHGVIAYAETGEAALALIQRLQAACVQALGPCQPAPVAGLEGGSQDPWVASLASVGSPPWQPLCPDDVIYVGPDLAPPKVEVVSGQGVRLSAKDARSLAFMEEMLAANARASALARQVGTLQGLDRGQCEAVLGMEGEKYRQKLT